MDKDAILDRLRSSEAELRSRGVTHAALFGSRARGEARPDSDIDIMVEIAPEAEIDLFQYVGIVQYIEELFHGPVDCGESRGPETVCAPSRGTRSDLCFLTRRNWRCYLIIWKTTQTHLDPRLAVVVAEIAGLDGER